MYSEFRDKFPKLAQEVDAVHIQKWGEVTPETSFVWFESLANAINKEMSNEVEADKYKEVFEYIRRSYITGASTTKECIDVSFIENLFWGVAPIKAKPYWQLLPEVLKELYVNFHNKQPA